MQTAAGTRLGPYEILAPLGAGSMGEVYKAIDPRLHREVAVKILVHEGITDSLREKRFIQEAQAASALNHPNILTIFDVGSEDGTRYIVSELIEGHSLREELQGGPIPLKRFLELAIQLADGLAAAHQAGIIHRDLKPENIMITREGRVKILDFGLAKPILPIFGSDSEQTRSSFLTGRGVILGTMAYMSPEQARAKEVDFRSDQFSLGSVMFEMATGKKAFHRENALQTLTAILNDEPEPIAVLNPRFPALFRWSIERCLSKSPQERYASTLDLYHELRTFRDHLSDPSFPTEPLAPVKSHSKTAIRIFGAGVLLALLSLATGFGIAKYWLPSPGPDYSKFRYTPIATSDNVESGAAWSPDGKSIAYTSDVNGIMQIFARSLNSPTAAQITHSPTDCYGPMWTPDGTRVYYFSAREENPRQIDLWLVAAAGGSAQLIQERVMGAAVSPDGKALVFLRSDPSSAQSLSLWISSPLNSKPRHYNAAPLGNRTFLFGDLTFSPDGKKLFATLIPVDKEKPEYWILPYPNGVPRQLPPQQGKISGCSWMPDSRHVVMSSNFAESSRHHLFLLDTENGESVPLTTGISNEYQPSVSPDGKKIVYTSATFQYDLVEVPLDGEPIRNLVSTERDSELGPAWSPNGNQFVYVSDRTGSYVIWLRSSTEGWERPLVKTEDFAEGTTTILSRPSFSPDGQRLAYHRGTSDGSAIWISNLNGGLPVRLYQENAQQFCPVWSPDGVWITYIFGKNGKFGLAKFRVGGNEPPVVLKEDVIYYQPQWSPSDRWISYQTSEGLFLVSPDGRDVRQLSGKTWLANGWSKDGSSLFGIRKDEKRHILLSLLDPETSEEKVISDLGASPLFEATDGAAMVGFSLSPDGSSFATSMNRIKGDLWLLEGFEPR